MSLMGDFIFVFFEISGVRLIYIYILNFLFIVGIIESLFWKRFKWQNMQCKSNSVRKPIRKHNLTLFYVKKRKVFFYLFIYLFKSDTWKYVCLLILINMMHEFLKEKICSSVLILMEHWKDFFYFFLFLYLKEINE